MLESTLAAGRKARRGGPAGHSQSPGGDGAQPERAIRDTAETITRADEGSEPDTQPARKPEKKDVRSRHPEAIQPSVPVISSTGLRI